MRFLTFILSACMLLGTASAATKWHQLNNYTFEDWCREFNKVYTDDAEFQQRKQIFDSRLTSIQRHNSNKHSTYKQGVNSLSDRTETEYRSLLGYKHSSKMVGSHHRHAIPFSDTIMKDVDELPTSVDYRKSGVVGAVKDQGGCGSCWAFGTSATVESHWAIKTGQLAVLSEQQILDCTPNTNKCGGTGGCGGGTPEIAYDKLIELGGQASEWTYPYVSYHGQNFPTCGYSPSLTPVVAPVKGYVIVPSNNQTAVLSALSVGPLAINVDASDWSSYESGVFTGCNMNSPDINHVVELVGYGNDEQTGKDYYIIKNSWTPAWGENGYIRIEKRSEERCGIDTRPSDGTGCTGGPSEVKVCGECGILYDTSYPTF